MIKFIKKISFPLFALLLIVSCENSDYLEGPEFSKAALFSPIGGITNEDNSSPFFQINDFVSISDVSIGVLSREWTIEKENFFLKTFQEKDTINLEAFIDETKTTVSTEQDMFMLFKKVGPNVVNYRGVFKDSTAFQALNGSPGRTAIPAVKEGNVWVLSVDFNYTVIDSIKPEVTISNADGSSILGTLGINQFPSRNNTSAFPIIEIEAGTVLKFTDNTTVGFLAGTDANGDPNTSRVWNFEGASPETSTELTQDVAFNRTGEYIFDITINRAQRGRTLPFSKRKKVIPYIIKVVPSTQPFVVQGAPYAINDEDNLKGTKIINLDVNGELEPFSGVESKFTLSVVDRNGNPINVSVSAAEVDVDNSSKIKLTLDAAIFNTDVITLSYTGNSTQGSSDITAVDGRPFAMFTNETVTPLVTNFLTSDVNPSFEQGVVNETNANAANYDFTTPSGNTFRNNPAPDNGLILDRSNEESSEGDFSMRFRGEMPLQGGFMSLVSSEVSNLGIPAGDYKLLMDIFIKDDGSVFNGVFMGFQGAAGGFYFDFGNPTPGTWVTIEREVTFSNDLNRDIVINFRNNDNSGITGIQTFYIDNIKLENFEIR